MLSGPTCRAAWTSTIPAMPPAISAYTGHSPSIAETPDSVRVSVEALMNVATSAHTTAAADAYRAALRRGDPQRAASAIAAAPPPNTTSTPAQAWVLGVGVP